MDLLDEIFSSNVSSNETADQNSTMLPLPLHFCFSGGTTVVSLVGFYVNLVLSRSLFKSTLLSSSHRRGIRFFCFLNAVFAGVVIMTSGSYLIRDFLPPLYSLMIGLFILVREISRTAHIWIVIERILYNRSEDIREDRNTKPISILRVVALIFSFLPAAVLLALLSSDNPTSTLLDPVWRISLAISALCPFLLLIVLYIFIVRTAAALRLSQGLVAGVRKKKLVAEKVVVARMVLPLLLTFSVYVIIEELLFLFPEEYFVHVILLLYTLRILNFPISQMLLQPHIREDCRLNVFLWRKLQRRSSEARVRTIMNKESQESIITNFKMIGILSE